MKAYNLYLVYFIKYLCYKIKTRFENVFFFKPFFFSKTFIKQTPYLKFVKIVSVQRNVKVTCYSHSDTLYKRVKNIVKEIRKRYNIE